MSVIPESTVGLLKSELMKLQAKESVLKAELKKTQAAIKFLQKTLNGAQQNDH